jgi:DNA invertase Pin-like site-specific DNA recombinase
MARRGKLIKAVGYMRTSSAANVGRDSDKRQHTAISAYAKRAGFEIVDEFCDPAISGADPIETRPGFTALLDRIETNGVRVVIVEDASRFARDLITQELGIVALVARGVTVLTASGDDLTNTDDPFKVAMRQIAGAFAQLEKCRLVAKLKAARDRKLQATGKCGGRKSYAEANPEMVQAARELSDQRPRLSLRKISAALAERGFKTPSGANFSASSIKSMLSA